MSAALRDLAVVIAACLVMTAALLGAGAVGVLWIRRQWRRQRVRLALQARALAVSASSAGLRWLWTRPRPDRRWVTLCRARRQLHRAVDGAERAVGAARLASAPLGDLESLCRRLRRTATDADRALQIAQQSSEPSASLESAISQARALSAAGRDIQLAAAASLGAVTGTASEELVNHVRIESRAMARDAT